MVEMSECPRVACTRCIFAPRSIAWDAWACLSQCGETSEAFLRPAFFAASLTTLSAWRAVIGLGPPSGPLFWERNSGGEDPLGPLVAPGRELDGPADVEGQVADLVAEGEEAL